jgi:hypothetical protein
VPAADATLGIAASIKRFRLTAKVWQREHRYVPQFDNNSRYVPQFDNNYRFVIDLLDFVEETRVLSQDEFTLRSCARGHLADSVRPAVAHWKQRGKVWALKEGDANTRYFHARASQRYRWNHIRCLDVDDVIVVGHEEKAAALHSFYSNLLGRERAISWGFNLGRLYRDAWVVYGPALVALSSPMKSKRPPSA